MRNLSNHFQMHCLPKINLLFKILFNAVTWKPGYGEALEGISTEFTQHLVVNHPLIALALD